MKEITLSVEDILKRDLFKRAKVIAGRNGLDRRVRWAHVLEVQEFGSVIHGDELILTTGVGLQLDHPSQIAYVKKLIDLNVACLCIEMGSYFKEIPDQILEIADENDFPIIIFEETVKFIDITQDLHGLIVNHHNHMLHYLDKSSRRFIELSLAPNGLQKILQELYKVFQRRAMFISTDSKSHYYPLANNDFQKMAVKHFEELTGSQAGKRTVILNGELFAIMPVEGLGQIWGYICLLINNSIPEEFDYLMLDRAALAIAQILVRNRTIEERKQHSEDRIVRTILHRQTYDEEEVQMYLPFQGKDLLFRVFIIKTLPPSEHIGEEEWDDIKLQRSMMIRSLFKRFGFFPAVTVFKDELAVIAAILPSNKKEKENFQRIIHQLTKMQEERIFTGSECVFGIGRTYKKIGQLPKSYEEAKEVLTLHQLQLAGTSFFYDDLGIYRVLLPLKKSGSLEIFVNDYLGPIIEHDGATESDLLTTLKVYLECSGAKKEASDQLFIVRQTLYHRLEKIKQLLGEDFMEPGKRLAIETAIKAYNLIKK
ncbi:PucR family transcriptional regulator ligand-binding domain-containing protein [Bacillus sp. FJAT-29790]|nr:PucR family transcriptional regulator ligand-binding domain-containing protein [Bacillus sp. FJAT-29790]